MPSCRNCFYCWGTTKEGKAKCYAYPSGNRDLEFGTPIHGKTLVDQREDASCSRKATSGQAEEARLQAMDKGGKDPCEDIRNIGQSGFKKICSDGTESD